MKMATNVDGISAGLWRKYKVWGNIKRLSPIDLSPTQLGGFGDPAHTI